MHLLSEGNLASESPAHFRVAESPCFPFQYSLKFAALLDSCSVVHLKSLSHLNSRALATSALTILLQDAKRVVKLWESEFARAPDIDRQITLLYLANDILQNSRRKGPEFVNEFYHVMPRPISHLLRHGDTKACPCKLDMQTLWSGRLCEECAMHMLQWRRSPMAHRSTHLHEHGGAMACWPALPLLVACRIFKAC